ncbi:hypothetical protein B296_00018240 [Ensete ventricosum]|uniref:Uncharacterized protein n=1 Tax=Ensete ventricosum TaxID=4639 RepID=A0A426YXI7_ENSVE|nr:hypothetical protein B296_00018240 [Ensete ventricosum]
MAADGWEKSFEDENLDDMRGPAIDDAILMKLLDESTSEEADGNRLESVIRKSLEDEIGAAGIAPEAVHRGEDCGLDDILSDLDGHDCSRSSTSVVEDSLGGCDSGEWYVDECMHEAGEVSCGDAKCCYHYGA